MTHVHKLCSYIGTTHIHSLHGGLEFGLKNVLYACTATQLSSYHWLLYKSSCKINNMGRQGFRFTQQWIHEHMVATIVKAVARYFGGYRFFCIQIVDLPSCVNSLSFYETIMKIKIDICSIVDPADC